MDDVNYIMIESDVGESSDSDVDKKEEVTLIIIAVRQQCCIIII